MKFENYQEKLNQLQKLIAVSNTGTPKELDKKLYITERTTLRMVKKLKEQKIPIEDYRKVNSYLLKNC